jgi:hypothetical protein
MELFGIFVNDLGEGLHAIKYDGQSKNEYDRLFEVWTDTFLVQKFFIKNQDYIREAYFERMWISELITKVLNEAEELQRLFVEYTDENAVEKLESLFKPLDNNEYKIPPFQETKAKVFTSIKFRKPILRLYALRIDSNTFILTGGAIKITGTMQEHPDTNRELDKLKEAKEWLENNNLKTCDDLIYYYDIEEG